MKRIIVVLAVMFSFGMNCIYAESKSSKQKIADHKEPSRFAQAGTKNSQAYDPTKDPGLPKQGKSVDSEKLKELLEKFNSGIGQRNKPQKPPGEGKGEPIPQDYSGSGPETDSGTKGLRGSPEGKLESIAPLQSLPHAAAEGAMKEVEK